MPVFQPQSRLNTPDHYRPVFADPVYRVSSGCFLFLANPGQTSVSRLGVVVAKKNIRKATRRNRIKRLVRECFRHHYFAAPLDLVVLARKTADTLDNTAVTKDLQALCRALDQKVSPK
jgi:ribonuclease P protein component